MDFKKILYIGGKYILKGFKLCIEIFILIRNNNI